MSRLQGGYEVADRYRLEQRLDSSDESETWSAHDARLERRVAIRLFHPDLDHEALAYRTGLAASLTHPRVVRIFDTGVDEGRFFTVTELLPHSLEQAELPLNGAHALQLALDITEALHHAHQRGVAHGNLHPGNVLVSEDRAKIGGFALWDLDSEEADPASDLVAAGRVLRAAVGASHGTVPDSPKGLGPIIEGLADGAYEGAGHAFDDLGKIPTPAAKAARRPRRRGRLVVTALLLAAVAAFGITQLGERSEETRFVPGGRIEGDPLSITGVTDFDPLGDGREGPRSVALIADGDPETFWSTERYQGGETFSGLKPGVGVILDLGSETEVGKAQIVFETPGCSFELRHVTDPDAPIGEWTVAAEVDDSPQSAAIVFESASSRYWLLWITGLTEGVPGARGAWACAVSEAELFAP